MIESSEWDVVSALPSSEVLIRILIIVLAALVLRWIVGFIISQTVRRVTRSASRRQNKLAENGGAERSSPLGFPANPLSSERIIARTRTLGSVARNISTLVIVTTALFVILDTVGVNIAAILASAGIIAAGLAFGAQNVIRDLLNGLFMVIEDQIGVGDSVVIGSVDGVVEVVGIRITQVRSYDGTLWFIRNGEINQVGNLSHGWGRAVCDVAVDGSANTNTVRELLQSAANTVAASADFAGKVLGPPEVFGIEHMSQDSLTFRIAVKTTADAQESVIRSLRSEVKAALDAAGVSLATREPNRTARD